MARLAAPSSSASSDSNAGTTVADTVETASVQERPSLPKASGGKQPLFPIRNATSTTAPTSRTRLTKVGRAGSVSSGGKSVPKNLKDTSTLFSHFSSVIVASLSHSNHSRTFMTIKHRQNSFKHAHVEWPHSDPSIATMGESGFVFLPHSTGPDHVVCFACGLNVSNWESGQDPFAVHQELSPDCAWLQWKPDDYLKACYPCRLCTATFPRDADLIRHLSYHNTTKEMYDAAISASSETTSSDSLGSKVLWSLPAAPVPPPSRPSFLSSAPSPPSANFAKVSPPTSPSSHSSSERFATPPTSPKSRS